MASGTINLSSNISTLAGRINWHSNSNGSGANTSTVYAELQVHRTDNYTTTGTWAGSLTIDGSSQSFSTHLSISASWITLRSFNKTVTHNGDGAKSITISGVCNGPSGTTMAGKSTSGSASVTLDKIPRYMTSFSTTATPYLNKAVLNWTTSENCNAIKYGVNANSLTEISASGKSGTVTITGLTPNTSYTIYANFKRADSNLYLPSNAEVNRIKTSNIGTLVSVPDVNVGSTHTLSWTVPSGSGFSLNLKLCKTDNSLIKDVGDVTSRSEISWTPPASDIYKLSPNSNTYRARYILTTTAEGNTYTSSKDFNFNITNSNPVFIDFSYEDTNSTTLSLTGNKQIFIRGYSNNKVTIPVANQAQNTNSSTIKKYSLIQGSKSAQANYSSTSDVVLTINKIDDDRMTVSAIDSRGNATNVTKVISSSNYKQYTEPNIYSFTATRANSGISQAVVLSYSGTFWNNSFGSVTNSIQSISYRYQNVGTSSWSATKTLSPTMSGSNYSGSLNIEGDLGADGFTLSQSFVVELTVKDRLATVVTTTRLVDGSPAISIYKNKVSIGKKYDPPRGRGTTNRRYCIPNR